MPLTLDPCPAGEARGGAYLLALSADLTRRLLCTRMQGKARQGESSAHAVDARTIDGKLRVVYAGGGAGTGMQVVAPIQHEASGGAGFFVVLEAR